MKRWDPDVPEKCCACKTSLMVSKRRRVADSLEVRFKLNIGGSGFIAVSAAWCGGCARDGVVKFIAEWEAKLLGKPRSS